MQFLKRLVGNLIRSINKICYHLKYSFDFHKLYKDFSWTIQYGLQNDIGASKGQRLIPLINKSIERALETKIFEDRQKTDSVFFNVFPGEHYRFLAGLIQYNKPKFMIDIGTSTGMSSRIMIDYSDSDAKVLTYDLINWYEFDSHLTNKDFKENKITQNICNLAEEDVFNRNKHFFDKADLIFLDAPKDGIFEHLFLYKLAKLNLSEKTRYLIIDDIKFLNMIKLWRSINSPKFDLSSFGHSSGTGIVDISKRLEIDSIAFKRKIII